MIGLFVFIGLNIASNADAGIFGVRQVRVARVNIGTVRFNRVRIAPIVVANRLAVQKVVAAPIVVNRGLGFQRVIAPVSQRIFVQPILGHNVAQQIVVPQRITRVVEVPNLVEKVQLIQDNCGNVQRVQRIIVNGNVAQQAITSGY